MVIGDRRIVEFRLAPIPQSPIRQSPICNRQSVNRQSAICNLQLDASSSARSRTAAAAARGSASAAAVTWNRARCGSLTAFAGTRRRCRCGCGCGCGARLEDAAGTSVALRPGVRRGLAHGFATRRCRPWLRRARRALTAAVPLIRASRRLVWLRLIRRVVGAPGYAAPRPALSAVERFGAPGCPGDRTRNIPGARAAAGA